MKHGMTLSKPIIGVTGNSGSGKGTVCLILRDLGGLCLDADKAAHMVMESGRPAYNEICDLFGNDILAPDGSIDRIKLGGIVFHEPIKRKVLESIVHKQVKLEFERLSTEDNNHAFIIWDAPLLAEACMHKKCSLVLLITAPFSLKLSRIMNRDGITEERAILRLSNQPSDDALYKRITGDIGKSLVKVIENNGSIKDLEYKTRLAVCDLRVI